MDRDWDRRFGSAIRAADGTPDEDGTMPATKDPHTGRWDFARPHRAGNGAILMVGLAVVTALVWLAY
ncbi:hypothetical protein SAMN05216566_11285 [Aureimonas phyllosphaerae]|nr:hypothetical protein SAMN05216566_11285 [Aureimonas phyllosphaerae]